MGLSIQITSPEGFPDPQEKISSIGHGLGTIIGATTRVGFDPLDLIPTTEGRIRALSALVAEIDKGKKRKFSDSFCEVIDLEETNGREMRRAWEENGLPILRLAQARGTHFLQGLGYSNRSEYWGRVRREVMRDDAMRFLLYLAAGYKVEFIS